LQTHAQKASIRMAERVRIIREGIVLMRNKLVLMTSLLLIGCSVNTSMMTDQQLQNCKENAYLMSNRVACARVILDKAPLPETEVITPPLAQTVNYVNQNTGNDWVKIDNNLSFRKEYADNEFFLAWVKIKNASKHYAFVMSQWRINCKSKELQISKSVFYNKSGHVIDSIDEPTPYSTIVPETNGEAFYYYTCIP